MKFERSSGVLLHPTSLPGRHGCGTLGSEAYRFIDHLAEAGQTYWQVLPLGPTSYGNSPYQSLSAFAGNPLLIDLDRLLQDGLLASDDLAGFPASRAEHVDFGMVLPYVRQQLFRAFERFEARGSFERFMAFWESQRSWLQDFALFMALKDHHQGASWSTWDLPIRQRTPASLAEWTNKLEREIRFHAFVQYLFFRQFRDLKTYANERQVRLVGDLPIFVAHDSADVWAHPELFHLDAEGHPTVVAGVPPDYFSTTGQLWGNPLYRWEVMASDDHAWWVERVRKALSLYDAIRIDHFRGFEAFWEIPAAEPTAIKGRWIKGPGKALFDSLEKALGSLPIIAEDLGLITPEVEALRDGVDLPGMKILQFAFGGDATNSYLPHAYVRNCVVYTGTHDNDTTRGWFDSALPAVRAHALAYLGGTESTIVEAMIRHSFESVADLAVIPMQDWLGLDASARMNLPGRAEGNWTWRMKPHAFDADLLRRMKEFATLYGR